MSGQIESWTLNVEHQTSFDRFLSINAWKLPFIQTSLQGFQSTMLLKYEDLGGYECYEPKV